MAKLDLEPILDLEPVQAPLNLEPIVPEDPTAGGLAKQFLIGAANSAAFSVPELVLKQKFDQQESNVPQERIARGVGTGVGAVIGAPGIAFKIGSKLALKGIGKATPKLLRLAKVADKARKGTEVARQAGKARMAKAAIEGAGGAGLFNAIDPTTSAEEKPQNVLAGIAGGAVIGMTGQVLSNAIGNVIKRRNTIPKKAQGSIVEATKGPDVYGADGKIIQHKTPPTIHPSMQKAMPKEAKDLVNSVDKSATEMEAARRGLMPFTLQRKIASGIKIGQDDWENVGVGDVANVETSRALFHDLLQQYKGVVSSGFGRNQKDKFFANVNKFFGLRSELGRALGAGRDPQQISFDDMDFFLRTVKKLDPSDQKSLGKLFKQMETPGFWDMFMEFRTAGLLTSPFTQVRNVVGNSIARLFKAPERVLAGGANAIDSFLSGKPREVFIREGVADVQGMFRGMLPGLRNAFKALQDEKFLSDSRIWEAVKHRQAIPGLAGKIVRLPFRALNAMDEFYSTLGHTSSLYAQATRQAIKEGLKGRSISGRVAQLVKDPTSDMIEKAAKESLEQTFRNPLGPAAKGIQNTLTKSRVGKFIVPFFRTPVNLFKWTYQRAPTSIVSPKNWSDIVKGTAEERAEAVGRIALGQLVSATIFMKAMEGDLTGRLSSNKNERDSRKRLGEKPYAVKVGDKFVSYRNYEPISSWLAMITNTAEVLKEKDSPLDPGKATTIAMETVKMMKDQSFLRGVSDLTNALDDPERFGQQFTQNAVTSIIPTGLGYLARLQDPILRQPDSIPEAIKAKLPGFSKGVPERLDVWGRPITREGSLAQRALLPSGVSTLKPDLTESELLDLEVFPVKINKKYKSIPLTVPERNSVTRVEGKIAKQLLDAVTRDPQYQAMTPEDQQALLVKINREVRVGARRTMLIPKVIQEIRKLPTQEEKEALIEKITRKKIRRTP